MVLIHRLYKAVLQSEFVNEVYIVNEGYMDSAL